MALSGCSILGRSTTPIEILTTEQERMRLELDTPEPLSLDVVEWILVTPENVEDVWEKLQADGKHLVLFAITSDGYEQMSLNMVKLRNFISTQNLIIVQYKKYYEPEKEETK